MAIPLIGKAIEYAAKIIDSVVEDKDEANKLKSVLAQKRLEGDVALVVAERELEASLIDARASILTADVSGESFLQRNWRPITMLAFVVAVMSRWFGITADHLSQNEVEWMMELVKLGLGGYVFGRSAEKVTKVWKGHSNE